jgi:uncharacterized membrane protein (Fun14 family)
MATWKKVAIALAVLLMLGGLALSMVETKQPVRSGGAPLSGGATSLVGGEGTGTAGAQDEEAVWSEGMVRLGFSFFAAFCVGYALRRFLGLLVFAFGLAFLFLFVLAYAELIVVDWKAFDSLYENFVARVRGEFDEFRTFVTGSLPSTALAGLGLVAGFRRNR